MTTETKTEKTPETVSSDNKVVFGPLGKYAAIAVIMVSIIVTTAIMLDKQLNTVDEKIAAIEEQIAAEHAENTAIPVVTENATESATDTPIIAMEAVSKEVEIIDKNADEVIAVPAVVQNITETAEAATTETRPAKTITMATTTITETTQKNNVTADQFEMVAVKDSAQMPQAERLQKNQARIKAYKLEQKQHLAEIFTRIKALESKQLERYKANQDSRIVRLRKQISEQHQMIETLVLRNKELFELRAANIQRNQDNREQLINRI